MTTYITSPPNLPTNATDSIAWGQLYGSAYALAISEACLRHDGLSLCITENTHEALKLESELQFFGNDLDLLHFPDWETLPYDVFSPHQDITSQRLSTLNRLLTIKKGILIVPIGALMQQLCPRQYIEQHIFQIANHDKLDRDAFRQRLEAGGYQYVDQVMEHGEFSTRGSLIDLFPMGSHTPYRLDLFDDEIESIRNFNPSTQRSEEKISQINLLPAREFLFSEEGITYFRGRYRDRFEGNPQNSLIYRDISDGIAIPGCEYYINLFFEKTETLFDYLPKNTLLIKQAAYNESCSAFFQQVEERYEQRRYDIERPILEPTEIYLTPKQIEEKLITLPSITVQSFKYDDSQKDQYNFASKQPPALLLKTHSDNPSDLLQNFIDSFKGRILFATESTGRREALLDLLHGIHIYPKQFSNWHSFLQSDDKLGIAITPLEQGLLFGEAENNNSTTIIAESQIFGERAAQQRRRKQRNFRDAESIINTLSDLNIGAPVVHEENGVGRYLGLQTLDVGGNTTEFLTIEYANNDKLYVPVSSLHLISRYTGASAENAPLHRLGGEQWQRIRQKAAKQVRDVAAELLDIHARRAARTGNACKVHTQDILAFANTFPFEETPDQLNAINAVLEDMTSTQSMDRVVCGDVGFGKTEVALRAAFAAAMNSKQVALLVPTTLLAQQHFQNFKDRFADWPIQVECLSRFTSKKQQNEVIEKLATGKVDVVIGTHKLLQKDIKFSDLGLIIVDEEHRFGVRHKEQLKSLRAEVDILTLTATPIPRTLNMAIAGLRDLSIIATPPERRNAVKTFINEWNDNLILEACQRELKRGGQIYFVHNEVSSIERIAKNIQDIVPEARIAIAHGQLPERELESIMLDFYHQRHNILLCTTIIESGIDVPTANTIIINRADKFGLAQLHQLRGRVGRSHHHAYAYLVRPHKSAMTNDAIKRLEAIESLEDLGAGFTLASHDLEIRGAGELLGDEQSGQIHEVGYTLYTEMLERAVTALKNGEDPLLDTPLNKGTEIDLGIPNLLPADYIPDVHIRLVLYKRIANAKDLDDLKDLQVEMIDRFGLLPETAKNLFMVTELKLKTSPIGIKKIDANEQGGRIEFTDNPDIDPGKLIKLLQVHSKTYVFDGKNKLRFNASLKSPQAKVDFIEQLLNELTKEAAA